MIDTTRLDDLVNLKATIIRKVNTTNVTMLITWSKFGIVDIPEVTEHDIVILQTDVPDPIFQQTFTNDEAYLSKYSVKVFDWNVNNEYTIFLTINGIYHKTLIVNSANLPVTNIDGEVKSFDVNEIDIDITNTRGGINIDISSPSYDIRSIARNILIYKDIGIKSLTDVLPLAYVQSVPISYSIPLTNTDYSSVTVNGINNSSFSLTDFNTLLATKDRIIFLSSYNDGLGNYIEELDQDIIKYYDANLILDLSSFSSFNPIIHVNSSVLYHDLDTDKYYRYRDLDFNIPNQAQVNASSRFNTLVNLVTMDPNLDDTLDLYIPGVYSDSTTTANISSALFNTVGDFTSFNTVPFTSPTLSSTLSTVYPTASFMTGMFNHTDTNVIDNGWYTYEVVMELLDGEQYIIYRGYVRREKSNSNVFNFFTNLDTLETPVSKDNVLTEYDFTSGISRGTKAWLSSNPEDYQGYLNNLLRQTHC